ncbi:MAG: hypothetical protein M0D55_04965 [Elusimicrobiota bacterium]|nr:MAG: hypothetical protein M0D55_04965 [Elusimicrobiota bacterium]
MNTPLLLAMLLLAAPAALRADDDAPAAPASGPEAAEAARDKGYRAEEAPESSTTGGDSAPDAPAAPRGDPRVLSVPAQRPLGGGAGGRVASPGAGSGSASRGGAGLACEKSVPALTGGVVRKEIDFAKTTNSSVTHWEIPPHGAVVYKFKTPPAGVGSFFSTMGTNARPVPSLMTVSTTPCDFDVEKARQTAKKGGCHAWSPVDGGVIFSIGGPVKGMCTLKPDTVYYMSLRALTNPDQDNLRDGCADQFAYNPGPAGSRKVCGGIWKVSTHAKAGAAK